MFINFKNISLLLVFFLYLESPLISMEWTEETLNKRISFLQLEIPKRERGVNDLRPIQRGEEKEQIKNMKIELADLKIKKQNLYISSEHISDTQSLEPKEEEKEESKKDQVLYKIGEVEVDEKFLREVATSIFKREQQMEDIKEKMCTHGQQMCEVWKLGMQWGQIDSTIKDELKRTIKPNDIQSLLKRHDCALLEPNVIANPEQFLDMITTGHIELDASPDLKHYGIKIRKDFSPRILGTYYTREVLKGEDGQPIKDTWHKQIIKGEDGLPIIKELKSTRLFISFDIDDIAKNIIVHGIDSWNPKIDGRLTTICIDEKS